MNTHLLEAFVAVATLKSFSAAASRLCVTQPSISQRIKVLEDLLGVKLFERRGSDIHLTNRGVELLPYAERVLDAVHSLRVNADDTSAQHQRLRIGTVSSMASAWVPLLIDEMIGRIRHASFDLIVEPSVRLREKLLAGEVDVAIVMGEFRNPNVSNVPLRVYDMHWIASRRMTIPGGVLSLTELARYPIITHGRESNTYKKLEKLFREEGLWPVRLIACDADEAIIRVVEMGSAIGLINYACLEEHPSPLIRTLSCNTPLPSLPYFAVYHNDSIGKLGMRMAEMAQEICLDHPRMPTTSTMT